MHGEPPVKLASSKQEGAEARARLQLGLAGFVWGGCKAVCTQGSAIRAGDLQEELAITTGELPVEKKLPL